jgi:hypothetical protein
MCIHLYWNDTTYSKMGGASLSWDISRILRTALYWYTLISVLHDHTCPPLRAQDPPIPRKTERLDMNSKISHVDKSERTKISGVGLNYTNYLILKSEIDLLQ